MRRGQVSVRGETYDRLKKAANDRGMSISALLDALLVDVVPVRAHRPVGAGSDDQSLTRP